MIPLFLVGEVLPRLTTRVMRRAALTAVAVAIIGHAVPLQLGLVAAIVAGVAVGLATMAKETRS